MKSRGQAMAEMLVVLLALVPLWLALLSIAGLQDLALATQGAARYAAFDRVLAPEAAGSLALRVRRYQFDGAPGPVSAASASRDASWSSYAGLWVDPVTNSRWLATPASVSVATRTAALGGLAGAASSVALAAVAPAAPLAPGRFDLRATGAPQATVRADLGPVSLPFLPRPFVLSAAVSVLGDAWSSDDTRSTRTRVRGLAPLRVIEPVTAIVRPLTPLLALFEPRLSEFCPGVVAPDIVPADRLTPRPLIRVREYVRC